MKRLYFDYAAATPIDPKVLKAMEPYFQDRFYNPSANYLLARQARKDLESFRACAAQAIGARSAEVIFTAGATEANNLAIQGLLRRHKSANILYCATEHESVRAPAGLYENTEVAVDAKGSLDINALKNKINDKTVLVSVGYVNNELGTVQPLRQISLIISAVREERRASGNKLPILLHTDAAQAGNLFDLHVARLGVDLMTINGGKIYGPKQAGLLYIKAGVDLAPLLLGGGQETTRRSGTESLTNIAGLVTAIELSQKNRKKLYEQLSKIKNDFMAQIGAEGRFRVNGSLKNDSPHIVSLTVDGADNERLMMELDERGCMVATGSACSASSLEPSHVLSALGLSAAEARQTIRISFGRQTTALAADALAKILLSLTP